MDAVGRSDAVAFYDEAYSSGSLSRWRELSAKGKADHVEELCRGLEPLRIVEIGCGDGALLAELSARGFADELSGYDISQAAVALARQRPIARLGALDTFDGRRLPVPDRAFDLAILSHVLEHVDDPRALLAEAARSAARAIVEVPLEANVSARRASKRAGAAEIGHLQSLSRSDVRTLVRSAGLGVERDLLDPLPLSVHTFFAGGPLATARATAKAALRRTIFVAAPRLAERLFTLHYAALLSSS